MDQVCKSVLVLFVVLLVSLHIPGVAVYHFKHMNTTQGKWNHHLHISNAMDLSYRSGNYIWSPTELWKKIKRFNLQAPPVYDRKVTNLFFPYLLFP